MIPIKTGCFIVGVVLLIVALYLSSTARDRIALLAITLLAIALLG